MSREKIDDIVQYMKTLNEDDPLALLQDDLYDHGGQLMISRMSPNFEMALFTAQVTGSAILTDSRTRWKEINLAQAKNSNGVASYPFKEITDLIADKTFIFYADPQRSFSHYMHNDCRKLRKLFREILNEVKKCNIAPDATLINLFKNDLQKIFNLVAKTIDKKEKYLLKGKINLLIPKGGFVHNNVQRLLLKSGSQHHVNNVPMAIFLEAVNW